MTEAQVDHFGLCPICHRNDGYINVGRGHWFFCQEHKKTWFAGSNVFSSWRDQTEAEQEKIYNEIGLDRFETVEPYYHPTRAVFRITRYIVPANVAERWSKMTDAEKKQFPAESSVDMSEADYDKWLSTMEATA